MAGGDVTAFAHAEPLIKSYARSIRRMGPAGSGQLAKMANQIAVAGVIQGLAEAIDWYVADAQARKPAEARMPAGAASAAPELQ